MSDAYAGTEPVTAPGIHDMPRPSAAGQLTNQQMKRFGAAFVNRILATVLYALAGIRVLGVNPLGFLRAWADDLAQRANDAYANAAAAQSTADTALQLIGVAGAELVDSFERDDANDLGSGWDQDYGGGSGYLGIRGGSAHWFEVGGGTRLCNNVFKSPLSEDNGKVSFVVASNLAFVTTPPNIGLIARCNDDLDTYLLARINRTSIEIGYVIGGSYTQLEQRSYGTTHKGLWEFEFGVGGDPDAFRLLHNGDERLTAVDSGSASARGSSYRRAGFVTRAGQGFNIFFILEQQRPPDIRAWAASAA